MSALKPESRNSAATSATCTTVSGTTDPLASARREDEGEYGIRGVDAPVVVPALGDDDGTVLRTQRLVDELDERFAARAARRSLGHCRTRRVEAPERKRIDLAQKIRRRPGH